MTRELTGTDVMHDFKHMQTFRETKSLIKKDVNIYLEGKLNRFLKKLFHYIYCRQENAFCYFREFGKFYDSKITML